MKSQPLSQSEYSDSSLLSRSSALQDAQSFLREISATSTSITKNIAKYPQYCRKMQANKDVWMLQPRERIEPDEAEVRKIYLYAKYYNILYGDPATQKFKEKALNYVRLNFKD